MFQFTAGSCVCTPSVIDLRFLSVCMLARGSPHCVASRCGQVPCRAYRQLSQRRQWLAWAIISRKHCSTCTLHPFGGTPSCAPDLAMAATAGAGAACCHQSALSGIQTSCTFSQLHCCRALLSSLVPEDDPQPKVQQHLAQPGACCRGGVLRKEHDIVVAAYVLCEMAPQDRLQAIKALWRQASQALVLIEPGTPSGSAVIRAARQQVQLGLPTHQCSSMLAR